jgi:hypothetical protein
MDETALPPVPEPPPEPDPLAGLYGCLKDVTIILPDVDLTLPTGEVWWAEEAEGLGPDQPGV